MNIKQTFKIKIQYAKQLRYNKPYHIGNTIKSVTCQKKINAVNLTHLFNIKISLASSHGVKQKLLYW